MFTIDSRTNKRKVLKMKKEEKEKAEKKGYKTKDTFAGLQIYKTLADSISYPELKKEINSLANFLYTLLTTKNVINDIYVSQSFNQIKIYYTVKF
ncbi:MAG: hypothetical protein PHN88_02270 [Ignavibacteria bacterium]|nr:hypothetical protein [Ignavibacteria bacterium]